MIEERLSEARKIRKLSQKQIAEVLGIPQQQYSRYENGKFEIPVRYVVVLCKFYGISADWLLGLKEEMQ
ncbi:MAG: helix-turn-helix transcriptional regulator [Oscillospiraceae bacterium]|nr:helix-turn-helix transcriptional regulator [Oscillospiraceae bacterium]